MHGILLLLVENETSTKPGSFKGCGLVLVYQWYYQFLLVVVLPIQLFSSLVRVAHIVVQINTYHSYAVAAGQQDRLFVKQHRR